MLVSEICNQYLNVLFFSLVFPPLLDYSFEKIVLDYPEEFQHLDDFEELRENSILRSR